jgi:hypothetical protein
MSRRGGHDHASEFDAVTTYGIPAVCPKRDCAEVNNTSNGMDCTECGTPLFPSCGTCQTSIMDTKMAVTNNGQLFCSVECVADDI